MKINELLQKQNESQKLDEILPAIAGLALRAAPAIAKGAAQLGGAALRGLGSMAKGATSTAGRATQAANQGARLGKAAGNLSPQDKQQQQAQDNKLKSTLSKLQGTIGAAGGGQLDVNKAAQTLVKPPSGTPDAAASKNLEPLIPALAQALKHSGSAELIAQALKTGVKTDISQQAKDEQDQIQQAIKSIKT